jgi:hypothetical protein
VGGALINPGAFAAFGYPASPAPGLTASASQNIPRWIIVSGCRIAFCEWVIGACMRKQLVSNYLLGQCSGRKDNSVAAKISYIVLETRNSTLKQNCHLDRRNHGPMAHPR